MPNINNISRAAQNNKAFDLNDIGNLARNTGAKSKLVLADGQFTQHATNKLTRFFSNIADSFSSKRADANQTSLNAFKQEIKDKYGAAGLDLLARETTLTGAKSLTAGLVTRCIDVINDYEEDAKWTGKPSLLATPPQTPLCQTPTASKGQKSNDYGTRLAEDYAAQAQNMPEQDVKHFAKQYVTQIGRDLQVSPKLPDTYNALSSMKAKINDGLAAGNTVLALNQAIDKALSNLHNPNTVKPQITTLYTAVQSAAPLLGRPIDASTLKPTKAGQGQNMCFIMSAVRSMLSKPSTTQALLNRIRVDDNNTHHIKLTNKSGLDTQDLVVDVPALALKSQLHESNGSRPEAFAALECAIANVIVDQNLDPEYTLGGQGLGENTLSLLGFKTVADPANMFKDSTEANFTASLKNFLSQPNNVVILRTPESGGHWLSILPGEGDNVIIGDSLKPAEEQSMSLSELHGMIIQGSGYQLSGGTLPS